MEFIIKKIASSITEETSFKKRLDFLYFLPFISKLDYLKALKFAEKRGLFLSEKYKNFFEESVQNIKNSLELSLLEAEKIAKNMFIKSSFEELEACLIAKRDINYLNKYVEIDGIENFYKIKNKGIIITIIHVGSFASVLCKTAFILKDFKFNAISWDYRTSDCPVTLNFLEKKMKGMNFFYRGKYFFVGKINPKNLFNSLKNKEILIIAIDAPLGNSQFTKVKFLKKEVNFPYSAIKIAYKTNSVIIPLLVYRDEYKIIGKYLEPISILDTNYAEYLQNIFSLLEKNIYQHPDEFFYWTSPTSWRTLNKL